MKTRRPLAILAATAIAGSGLTALATPASGNEITVTIGGSWTGNPLAGGQLTFSPSGAAGETFETSSILFVMNTPTFLGDTDDVRVLSTALSEEEGGAPCVSEESCIITNSGQLRLYVSPDSTEQWVRVLTPPTGESFSLRDPEGVFKVSYVQASISVESEGESAPAPALQQFPIPATGTCDEAQPEGLNWGGASSGGWGESWAEWANEGQGGAVCTRTLAYNNSTGTWQVQ